MNKIKFEPCGNLVNQAFSQFIENLINSQDPHSQTSVILNFMPKILLDYNIGVGIKSLNSKQAEVSSVIHTCAKDYVKYDKHDVEPVHIFLSSCLWRHR